MRDRDGEPVALHLVMDNYAAHKHPNVKTWVAEDPPVRRALHPNPHLVDEPSRGVWSRIVERQAINRGAFTSVKDLNIRVRAFINGWHDRAHPFVWTSEPILAKANRPTTSDPRH